MRASAARIALVLLTLALAAGPAAAGSPRSHEDGFFLRLSLGAGAARTETEFEGLPAELSGAAGDLNIAVGAVVSPNFAIHGTLFGWSMTEAELELGGLEAPWDVEVSMGAVGVGFTYYFMPANLYFSSSVGAGSITLDNGDRAESDTGVALDFTLGKEWWVGDGWGLGAALGFGYHSIPDDSLDENFSGTSFTLRFTATMN